MRPYNVGGNWCSATSSYISVVLPHITICVWPYAYIYYIRPPRGEAGSKVSYVSLLFNEYLTDFIVGLEDNLGGLVALNADIETALGVSYLNTLKVVVLNYTLLGINTYVLNTAETADIFGVLHAGSAEVRFEGTFHDNGLANIAFIVDDVEFCAGIP